MLVVHRAFTLIELLVVIAIIAILAAILFPVFAEARQSARKTVWLSNKKQVGLGMVMYANDHDERMVLSNSGGIGIPGWGFGRPDFVWPELIQPYVRNWIVFRNPADPNATDVGLSRGPFGNPVPATHPEKHYYWGSRSNIGLNYQFLSPWVYYWDTTGYVGSESVGLSQITQTANTLMTVETIWDRNTQTGQPEGGGNWVAEPPCIRDSNGNLLIPVSNVRYYQGYQGWVVNRTGRAPFSWLEFGGAWPFFRRQFTVSFTDGHVRSLSLARLTAGCDVRTNWAGAAFDGDAYIYDLR